MRCRTISVPVHGYVHFSQQGGVKKIDLTRRVTIKFSDGNPVVTPKIVGDKERAIGLAEEILEKELGELPDNLEVKASPSTWGCYQPAFTVWFKW